MMDNEDEGTRIGVWVAMGVVFFVLAGVLGGVTLRQMNDKTAPAKPAASSAASASVVAEPQMLDLPLSGELLGKLYFDSGSAALPGEAPGMLAAAVKMLADMPARKLLVSGFHDSTGDAAKNAELAKQRALAVRDGLLAAGGDSARVLLRKPESTSAEGSLQEARRVELRLID